MENKEVKEYLAKALCRRDEWEWAWEDWRYREAQQSLVEAGWVKELKNED